MHDKKSLALIAVAIFSAVLILANGNIQKAYALTVFKDEPEPTATAMTGVGYNAVKDLLLAYSADGPSNQLRLHIINGSTLEKVAEVSLSDIASTSPSVDNEKGFPCSATICIAYGNTINPPNSPVVVRINMLTYTVSAYYQEDSYTACTITNLEMFGTTIYATMADFGGCPYTGVYSLPTNFSADGGASDNQWVQYDSVTSVGDTNHVKGSCLIEGRYWFFGHTSTIRKYDLSTQTLTTSATLGSTVQKIDCDTSFSGGYVYVTLDGALDGVKKVAMSNLAIDGTMFTINNPENLMVRGDTVYISRADGTATITALDKSDMTSSVAFYTAEDDNLSFFKGNSTRFNALSSGGSNDNIFYRLDGILNTENEDENTVTTGDFCIDTNGDGDGDVCYTDTNGDGIVDAGGVLEVVTNQNPPAQAVGGILCQLAIIEDCTNGRPTNTDTATNGTGLILFFALLAVLMAVIGSALYGKIKIEYNLIVQVVILMVATGLAVAFGWIEEMWFYIMIFIIIGFASLAGASWITGMRRGQSIDA